MAHTSSYYLPLDDDTSIKTRFGAADSENALVVVTSQLSRGYVGQGLELEDRPH